MKPTHIALVLLGLAYLYAVYTQFQVEQKTEPTGADVINIVHWHLEEGFREAMEVLIEDFEELHAREGREVKVVQRAIPRNYYEPWLNTNLVGGTAPDLIEIPLNWWRTNLLLQNFRQIDTLVGEPNRFNDFDYLVERMGDLDLHRNLSAEQRKAYAELQEPLLLEDRVARFSPEFKEWARQATVKSTFLDGLIGGFNYDIAAYYSYPISMAPQRLFYNRELLRQAGYEEPPMVLHEFFEMCEELEKLQAPDGNRVIPVAAHNRIAFTFLTNLWARPFTWRTAHQFDYLLTGDPPFSALFAAWETGQWDFYDPRTRAYFQSARKLASYFQPGFMSMQRDQATFAFVQQRTAMFIASANDAAYLFGSTDFDVGVTTFPLPGPGDPYGWDDIVDMGIGEATDVNGLIALNARSEHPELAREFAEFITSVIWNERFNRYARMMPSVIGARPAEDLMAFVTDYEGAIEVGLPTDHPDYALFEDLFLSQFWVYVSGQIADEERAFEVMVREIEEVYGDPRVGINRMWRENYERNIQRARNTSAMLNINAAVMLLQEEPPTEAQLKRYHRMLMRDAAFLGGERPRLYHDYMHRENPRPFPAFQNP